MQHRNFSFSFPSLLVSSTKHGYNAAPANPEKVSSAHGYSSDSGTRSKRRRSPPPKQTSKVKWSGEYYVFQPQPQLSRSTAYTAGLDVFSGYSTPPPGGGKRSSDKRRPPRAPVPPVAVPAEGGYSDSSPNRNSREEYRRFYKPAKRSFAEYLALYSSKLRKKGKRVTFRPVSRGSDSYHHRYQYQYRSPTPPMGSSYSRTSIEPPLRGSGKSRGFHSSTSKGGTYGYYYHPQATSHQSRSPESAFYLGTESIPPLHSLGRRSPKRLYASSSTSGGSRSRSHHGHNHASSSSHRKGKGYAEYSGIDGVINGGQGPVYYSYQSAQQPSSSSKYRHQGASHADSQPRVVSAADIGGVYVLGSDGRYYWQAGDSSHKKPPKREREESRTRGSYGVNSYGGSQRREKKLRRSRAVEDMRGRSLRGGHAAWVEVGA